MLREFRFILLKYESKNKDHRKKDPLAELGSQPPGNYNGHRYLYSGDDFGKGCEPVNLTENNNSEGPVYVAATTVYSVVYGIAIKVFKVLMLIAGFT